MTAVALIAIVGNGALSAYTLRFTVTIDFHLHIFRLHLTVWVVFTKVMHHRLHLMLAINYAGIMAHIFVILLAIAGSQAVFEDAHIFINCCDHWKLLKEK
uniref:Uncharacterized protein n=1 Tax=Parascaris equorum TaxID=6256 RepID=A0A914S577_PAREQ